MLHTISRKFIQGIITGLIHETDISNSFPCHILTRSHNLLAHSNDLKILFLASIERRYNYENHMNNIHLCDRDSKILFFVCGYHFMTMVYNIPDRDYLACIYCMDTSAQSTNDFSTGHDFTSALRERIRNDLLEGESPPSCNSPMITKCDGYCALTNMNVKGEGN